MVTECERFQTKILKVQRCEINIFNFLFYFLITPSLLKKATKCEIKYVPRLPTCLEQSIFYIHSTTEIHAGLRYSNFTHDSTTKAIRERLDYSTHNSSLTCAARRTYFFLFHLIFQ